MLDLATAEAGHRLQQAGALYELVWNGDLLDATLRRPHCHVTVRENGTGGLRYSCSACGEGDAPCPHAVAVLFRWVEVRPNMERHGPGTTWRSWARQPFLAGERGAAQRLDLGHLEGAELAAALAFQLSLHREGGAVARLADDRVEVAVTLPSGVERTVTFPAGKLPHLLPHLRQLPALRLDAELEGLELSEVKLRPVLVTDWRDDGIHLEPGYELPGGEVIPLDRAHRGRLGSWARIGHRLCRLLDPPTPLVPFFEGGRRLLTGRDAIRFLTLDHPALARHPWYRPRGILRRFARPHRPRLVAATLAELEDGSVRLVPEWEVGGERLDWNEARVLERVGFLRKGDVIAQAPDLEPLTRLGFRVPRRGRRKGMVGDRLAALRLVAEAPCEVRATTPELERLLEAVTAPLADDPPQPPGLRSHLRPYQRVGVAWLARMYRLGLGALLADDMGLGKTHQAMGLLATVHQERPEAHFLVVCPRGVLEHWHRLLVTYAPGLPVRVFHGPGRDPAGLADRAGVVLTTYETAVRSAAELAAVPWEVAIFDEAQKVKNPRTKAARAARSLPARFKLALTGTPVENRLLELWSVVDLVLPGYLGSERAFRAAHRQPGERELLALRRRVGLLTLRRVKEKVLDDLPPKQEDLRICRLTERQAELYRALAGRELPAIAERLADPEAEVPYLPILALITRLKQVCDHPALVTGGPPSPEASGKLQMLDELLDEALAAERQVVVFSQYVKMIELLARHLGRRRIPHLVLTGQTRDRDRVVRRFNSGRHEPVLLASLLAGGVGIDLTAASVVIHYDRWWNPAKEDQATDRVHRIGQRRFVMVYKLLTADTIEERIDRLIRSKAELMETVVAPTEGMLRQLSRKELAELLGIPDRR